METTYRSLGFASYNAYLQSDHWRAVRQRHLSKPRNRRCKACGGSAVHVHHRRYKNIGRERAGDLDSLCRRCHFRVHELQRGGALASVNANPKKPSVLYAATKIVIREGKFRRGLVKSAPRTPLSGGRLEADRA